MNKELLYEARQMQGELSAYRRALHQIPELGLELPETVAFVAEKLKDMGISYEICEESSCITALIGQGSPCFLLRSDMDGLPVREESGEPFASQNGNAHACGHDLHTAILLGAAKLLKIREKELNGSVKLLFQSGEEVFQGAAAAIASGVLENPTVDAAFAMHVASNLNPNVIIYGPYAMASVYGFRVKLTGKGAHGSTPHLGVDPINTGVHIYLALQELIAREVSATEEAVLTIGKFEGGTAPNIIPERVVMEGTLRTFKPEIRKMLIERIQEVIWKVADTYRTQAEIEVLSDIPPVVCNTALNEKIADGIRELDDGIKVLPLYHVMGSEDFAFFTEKIPASYFCIGAGVPDPSQWRSHHNPTIRFSEDGLALGAAVYAGAALDYLERRAKGEAI